MRNSTHALALLMGGILICSCGSNQSDLSANDGGGNLADAVGAPQADGSSTGWADSNSVASVDGGSGLPCCPSGFNLYGCQIPDGGASLACHNPALGCASSLVCGQGCDPEVSGHCQCAQIELCVVGDHFDKDLCKCVPDQDAATSPPVDDAHVCIDNVLCIIGDHFDSALCKCVPDVPPPVVTCTADADCPGQVCGPSAPLNCPPNATCLPIRTCVPTPCAGADCCTSATDCSGALPALCQQCGDGGTACAHFACVASKCEVAFCP